ncbi:MAG TPA: hypothetical protein PKA64_21600, partial [Myxococcota bacterium]|nr:hypothetical protein [Myxococcota bacterium]
MSEGLDAVVSVSGEGPDLKSAVADAAARLGLDPSGVEHKLDLAHFRTPSGSSMARRTVKVIAWPRGGKTTRVYAADFI